jgi:hypothetical protein
MQFSVFNMRLLFLSLFIFSFSSNAQVFNTEECIQAEFNTTVKHKGWPFGLHDVILKLEKKQCQLSVYHERFKYLKKNWKIDVCRGPVHIKMGTSSVEVFKRRAVCDDGGENSGYCSRYTELKRVIQDDGLIFAQGHKEDINTDHGRVNCAFILVKEYLNNGFVFSLHSPNHLNKAKQPQMYAGDKNTNEESSGTMEAGIPTSGMPADF